MKLQGKCAIITGANQGLGFEIAKHYVTAGMNVMLCARNYDKLLASQQELVAHAAPEVKILIKQTDISKPAEVEALVAETLAQFKKIDVLVANAGVQGTKGPIEEIDWQEWSDSVDINLKGTVLSCRSVIKHFKQNKQGKIIILSGGGATKPMPFLSAYAASKAAIVRFAETLAEELREFGIEVNAVAPGALNTRMLDEMIAAGADKIGEKYYNAAMKQQKEGGASLSLGASLCVFLASAKSNGITGKLISAVWDPWKKFPEIVEELKNSDIYTLRRIIPEDRGKNWSEA